MLSLNGARRHLSDLQARSAPAVGNAVYFFTPRQWLAATGGGLDKETALDAFGLGEPARSNLLHHWKRVDRAVRSVADRDGPEVELVFVNGDLVKILVHVSMNDL